MNTTTGITTTKKRKTVKQSKKEPKHKLTEKSRDKNKTSSSLKTKPERRSHKQVGRILENFGFDYQLDALMDYTYTGSSKITSLVNKEEQAQSDETRLSPRECYGYDYQFDMYEFSESNFSKLKSKRIKLSIAKQLKKRGKDKAKQLKENVKPKNHVRKQRQSNTFVVKAKNKNYIIKERQTSKHPQQRQTRERRNTRAKTRLKTNINVVNTVSHPMEFNLQCPHKVRQPEYNCLYDKNLQDFFCRSKRKMSHLMKMGLISEDGCIINIIKGGQKVKGKELCNFKEIKRNRKKYLEQTYKL